MFLEFLNIIKKKIILSILHLFSKSNKNILHTIEKFKIHIFLIFLLLAFESNDKLLIEFNFFLLEEYKFLSNFYKNYIITLSSFLKFKEIISVITL